MQQSGMGKEACLDGQNEAAQLEERSELVEMERSEEDEAGVPLHWHSRHLYLPGEQDRRQAG